MSTCNSCSQSTSLCNCACDDGCPIKLDMACIIYHKAGSVVSSLDGLGLNNGSTLELVIELLDEKIKQLDVASWSLPFLRTKYVINTLKQFGEAVDVELGDLWDEIATVSALVNTPLVANDSATIDFTTSGTLGHTLTGVVKVSNSANNLLSALADGLYAAPQTLSVNYTTKELTISNSNTVDLSALCCSPGGYLGNVASDPSGAIDGNYWFNTAQNKLKIKANGTIKEIVTV